MFRNVDTRCRQSFCVPPFARSAHAREPITSLWDPTCKWRCAVLPFTGGKPASFLRNPPELSVQRRDLTRGGRSALFRFSTFSTPWRRFAQLKTRGF